MRLDCIYLSDDLPASAYLAYTLFIVGGRWFGFWFFLANRLLMWTNIVFSCCDLLGRSDDVISLIECIHWAINYIQRLVLHQQQEAQKKKMYVKTIKVLKLALTWTQNITLKPCVQCAHESNAKHKIRSANKVNVSNSALSHSHIIFIVDMLGWCECWCAWKKSQTD